MTEVKSAQAIELESLDEMIRLVVSTTQNRGGHIYYAESNGKYVFTLTNMIPGWYDLKGLPITVYTTSTEEPRGKFIAYTVEEGDKERWEYKNSITPGSGFHLPLIRVKELPKFLLDQS